MRIIIDGKNILEGYVKSRIDDRYLSSFIDCLPCNSDGLYTASKGDGKFWHVTKSNVVHYPLIKINSYERGYYDGVNEQGISLLAFDIDDEERDLVLHGYPSYICMIWGGFQLIYRLRDFIPFVTTDRTLKNLVGTIRKVSENIGGRPTNEIVNPACDDVDALVFPSSGFSLKDIRSATKRKASREQIREARAKGGWLSGKGKKEKSIRAILTAIEKLKAEGKKVNQTSVAPVAGLSRKTVNKHWPDIMREF